MREVLFGAGRDEERGEVASPDIGTLALVVDKVALPLVSVAGQIERGLLERVAEGINQVSPIDPTVPEYAKLDERVASLCAPV